MMQRNCKIIVNNNRNFKCATHSDCDYANEFNSLLTNIRVGTRNEFIEYTQQNVTQILHKIAALENKQKEFINFLKLVSIGSTVLSLIIILIKF